MRSYPTNWWTLKFLGGTLNGRDKRYPYAPVLFSAKGEQYRLVTTQDGKRLATYMVKA